MILPKNVPWDAARWVYLHTLTFSDPEPSYDEARRRWDSFLTGYLSRAKRFGVCVPEFGKRTNRLHFHLVTTERFDASEMWVQCAKYGFGRYDVRRRPCWRIPPSSTHRGTVHEACWYLAKYVGKRHGWPDELKGSRQWSVFGAKHFPNTPVRVRDVRITTKELTVVKESSRPFSGWSQWSIPNYNLTIRVAIRRDALPTDHVIMRELSPEQAKKVLSLVAAGDVVGVGEYRYCGVETKKYKDFKDSSKTIEAVVVTHKVDFGATFERREFDERMPEGTTEKAVTPPAKSGELVAVCVDGMRAFQGGTNYRGRIIKL